MRSDERRPAADTSSGGGAGEGGGRPAAHDPAGRPVGPGAGGRPCDHDPTRRFGDRVEHYARHRPGYPAAVLDLLEREAGLAAGDAVADVGSGTGILSAQLLDRGWEVWAVEPNGPMREEAERRLGSHPGFHSVAGRAEATGLADGSVDCVTAGQAFHWFDRDAAREELLRILRPRSGGGAGTHPGGIGPNGGWAFLLWNTRRTEGTPFLRELEAFLRAHGTDLQHVRHDRIPDEEIRRFFGGAFRRAVFPNEQVFDLDGLRGRVLSMSFVPGEEEPGREAMLEALEDLFARHADGERVRLEYDTQVWYGRLRREASGPGRRGGDAAGEPGDDAAGEPGDDAPADGGSGAGAP